MNRTFGVKPPPRGDKRDGGKLGKVKGLRKCPECGQLYVGEPEEKVNETSGIRWRVYTHPDKQCRHFYGGARK